MIIMFKSLIKRIVVKKTNLIVQKKIEIATVVIVVVVDENIVDENDVDKHIFKKLKIDINFELILNDIIHHMNTKVRRSCISKIVEKKYFD